MTYKVKKGIWFLCMGTFIFCGAIFIVIMAVLTIREVKKSSKKFIKQIAYKYDGAKYDDSYDYENKYGYKCLKSNDKMAELYADMYYTAIDFEHKNEDAYSKYGVSVFYYFDGKKNSTLTFDEALSVFYIFEDENPQFYWINLVSYDDNFICFKIGNDYTKKRQRLSYKEKIEKKLSELDAIIEKKDNDYDKIHTIYYHICKEMEYAYDGKGKPVDENWAHNIIGFFDKGKGVCESYAKTFKYLCDIYGIENIPMWSETHIWNLILYDGEWYVFDVTGERSSLFGTTEEKYVNMNKESHEYSPYCEMFIPSNMARRPLASSEVVLLYEDGILIYSTHSLNLNNIFSRFNGRDYIIELASGEVHWLSSYNNNYNSLFIHTKSSNAYVRIDDNIVISKDFKIERVYFTSVKDAYVTVSGCTLYIGSGGYGPDEYDSYSNDFIFVDGAKEEKGYELEFL